MASRVVTVAFQGVEARRVDVEVQLTTGEVKFMLVGLGDKAVAESRERVRAAFAGLGLAMPSRRIIVNLAPADLPKEGSHYDLPIALALLAAIGALPGDQLVDHVALGELSLDGRLRDVRGALLLSTQGGDIDSVIAADRYAIFQAFTVATLPFGVRIRNPCLTRYGSETVSRVSASSPTV